MSKASRAAAPAQSATTITVSAPTAAPPPPAPPAPAKDFWEAVHTTTEEQWRDERVVYVYRDNPATPGMKGNIGTFRQDFDEETIRETFGGYQYRLMLVRRKTGTMIAATQLDIAAPPKAVGKVDPAMSGYGAAAFAPGTSPMMPGSDVTSVLNQFVGVMRDQIEKSNPADKNTTELLMTAAKKSMELMATQTPNPMQMMQMMFEMQKQNHGPENNMMAILVAKMAERAFAPPTSDLVGQLGMIEKVLEFMGARGGGGAPKPDLGALLVNKLPDLVNGASLLANKWVEIQREKRLAAEANARGIAIARGQLPIDTTLVTPAAAAPPVNVMPTGKPTFAQLDREPATGSVTPAIDAGAPSMDWLRGRVVQLILMSSSTEMIVDFISASAPELVAVMRSASVDELRDFFVKDEILAHAVAHPGFEQFLKEAHDYLREENVPEAVN